MNAATETVMILLCWNGLVTCRGRVFWQHFLWSLHL